MLKHYVERDTVDPSIEVVAGSEHRALAREVASSAFVLLKNDIVDDRPVLPLDPSVTSIAVIGHLAAEPNLGDHGSSIVDPPTTSSPLDGIREAFSNVRVDYVDGRDISAATAAAAAADVAIVVAGMSWNDEGERIENEDFDVSLLGFPFNVPAIRWLIGKLPRPAIRYAQGGDRSSLRMHAEDEELISRVAEANARTAVVVIGGSAIIMENWRWHVPTILMGWYPGMEGGRALADVLTGTREPRGRLPFAIPTDESHLPFFDADARSITYDAWWGQRKLDKDGNAAAYPFGFGLGYTTFDVELLDHSTEGASGLARAAVRNTGSRSGSAVVQAYAVDVNNPSLIPQLVGFARIELAPGASGEVEIGLDLTPTLERDPLSKAWTPRSGQWELVLAQHSPSSGTGGAPFSPVGSASSTPN